MSFLFNICIHIDVVLDIELIESTKVHGGLFKGSQKLLPSEVGLFVNHERFSVPRVDTSPSIPGSALKVYL